MDDLPEPPARLTHAEVEIIFSHRTPDNAPEGFVAGYHFVIRDARGREAGHINLRIGSTPHVTFVAGHVGYEILPGRRGHRYAEKACRALAPWAATFPIGLIITTDPDNHASIRTIGNLGARFIDEVDVPPDDPHFLRGSLRKRRYLWLPESTQSA
ncbi:GNAT family N-acetyltransferase [Luteolibacter sp. SL250]|uniref:GNAT family N-acetyltransferase n=1 Tax=Luteolibacter sp. SL250 TaxID=2995170 RepID=UPI0022713B8D|nr:GNAT family N-acetyltransferase [Luteolibacter sp. SL250]WAC21395.1 GNAT family N-acetyltransferase [Luteolibacter sp. SL250]